MPGKYKARTYKDLGAWQEGIALLAEIHRVVGRFPEQEREDLGERIYRAAVAVPARISEGYDCRNREEFLGLLLAAQAGLTEVETLLAAAEQLGCVSPAELERLEQACADAAKPLKGLIAKVRRDVAILRPEGAREIP
jgi:four helix bundle protein